MRHNLAELSTILHKNCLSLLPNSNYLSINQALLCGENLKEESLKQLFIQSGLYHIVVVSGAHLVFFAFLLNLFFKYLISDKHKMIRHIFIFAFFLIYTLACQLQPPLVRACLSSFILFFSEKMKLNYSDLTILLLSVFASLLFSPHWVNSLSLLLSATASLALFLTRTKKSFPFQKQVLIYFLIAPLLFGWGNLHPLTIPLNVFLAPVVSAVLLPITILTIPFRFLVPVSDFIMSLFLKILLFICDPNSSTKSSSQIPIKYLWIYLLFLILIGHIQHLLKKRDPK